MMKGECNSIWTQYGHYCHHSTDITEIGLIEILCPSTWTHLTD